MKLYDIEHMHRAIHLARQGEGWVHPNPLVGAVIVKDGRIIGEGYHERYGQFHAERNAIKSLMEPANGATMYVTLEPCAHHGKQPPCTEAIIENKIKRVVIGSKDPNPLVAGKGIEALRAHGIEVEVGVLEEECDALNPVFFHYIQHKTPYVTMKYAMTMDGKIATKTGASKWITNEESRNVVQKMRHANMGIMVGIGTILADNPMLDCRREVDLDPIRIICDSKMRIPLDCKVVQTAGTQKTILVVAFPTLPFGAIKECQGLSFEITEKIASLQKAGVELVNMPGQDDRVKLSTLMEYLGNQGIDSILLEGGGTLNESALKNGIVNEIRLFVAPKIFGGGGISPVGGEGVELVDDAYACQLMKVEQIEDDLMMTYHVCKR